MWLAVHVVRADAGNFSGDFRVVPEPVSLSLLGSAWPAWRFAAAVRVGNRLPLVLISEPGAARCRAFFYVPALIGRSRGAARASTLACPLHNGDGQNRPNTGDVDGTTNSGDCLCARHRGERDAAEARRREGRTATSSWPSRRWPRLSSSIGRRQSGWSGWHREAEAWPGAHGRQENVERALGHLIRAADLLPKDVQAQVDAAKALLASGRFEDARTRAEVAMKPGSEERLGSPAASDGDRPTRATWKARSRTRRKP
jgi:hypothetical protein